MDADLDPPEGVEEGMANQDYHEVSSDHEDLFCLVSVCCKGRGGAPGWRW